MSTATKSTVWNYFTKIGNSAKCKECEKEIICAGGSTSGLRCHLRSIHQIELDTENTTSDGNSKNKRVKLTQSVINFGPQQSLGDVISKLAAVDGLTIKQITTSSYIRSSLVKDFGTLPKSQNSLMNIIMKRHKELCENLKTTFAEQIKENNRFALTFDEYTSLKNK
jgi:hypothetical protein